MDVYVRYSQRIRKSPQWFDPFWGATRQWNSDVVSSLFYMIRNGSYSTNVVTDNILLLLVEWDVEDCMDSPSTLHMREYYVLRSQSCDPDTPTYMQALAG